MVLRIIWWLCVGDLIHPPLGGSIRGVQGGTAPFRARVLETRKVIKGLFRLRIFEISLNSNKIIKLAGFNIADLSVNIADLSKKYCRFVEGKTSNIADLSLKYCRFVEI